VLGFSSEFLQGNTLAAPFFDKGAPVNHRLKDDHCYRTTVSEYETYQKIHGPVVVPGQAHPKQVWIGHSPSTLYVD
jgi:hypothetical protein